MEVRQTYEQGDEALIEVTFKETQAFSDSKSIVDPDSMTITIENEYDDTTEIDSEDMTKDDTGEYYYTWNTSGVDEGDYVVTITGEKGGKEDVERRLVRVD